MPSLIFEELGLKYYGPVDGHDIPTLINTLEFLKRQDRPVLLHVLTPKGKGFEPERRDRRSFTGWARTIPRPARRVRWAAHLFGSIRGHSNEAGQRPCEHCSDHRGDAQWYRSGPVSEPHPDKYFDVGIAEEHAVVFAAGMAAQGLKPFAQSIPRSCSVLSIRSSTTCACKTCRWSSASIAEVCPPTMVRRITACSTSATCAAFRTWCT